MIDPAAAALALDQMVERESKPLQSWTFFVMDEGRSGTTWIESHAGATLEEATSTALDACAAAWDVDVNSLVVIGIALGDVQIVEWNDDC